MTMSARHATLYIYKLDYATSCVSARSKSACAACGADNARDTVEHQ